MSYRFPASLIPLRDWMHAAGTDVENFKSERQAAFFAQQLAGTRFKFPGQGEGLFPVLQAIQKSLPAVVFPVPVAVKPAPKEIAPSLKPAHSFDAKLFENGCHVFCDGACEPNPGPGGWGFVVYLDGQEIFTASGGDAATTNNIMELTGALEAMRWISENPDGRTASLHCDSQYVIKGCNEWRHSWKRKGWMRKKSPVLNLDLWKRLDAVLNEFPLTLSWVKGHAGIRGNERADELAEQGRRHVLESTK